jgi:competence protein ComGC
MSKREKIFLLIILILVVVVLFIGDYNAQTRDKIKDYNAAIMQLHSDNAAYDIEIDKLQDSILKLKKRDTVVQMRYREKIKVVEKYTKPDFITFYDTLLDTHIATLDTFICFDSVTISCITKKLLEGERDSILLNNCIGELQLCDSINSYKDSLIDNKDSEITVLNDVNKEKIKKLRRQRNTFAGATFVEFLVILGLISK